MTELKAVKRPTKLSAKLVVVMCAFWFFSIKYSIRFLFFKPKVKDTLPPMPKKQNLAMLEAPPEQKSTAYIGAPFRTLPPIGSAPPTGRQPIATTPRKLYTAPGMAETAPRGGDRPPFNRTNSTPPEVPQYKSVPSTRETVITDGEATAGESVGTGDRRGQPRADGRGPTRAERQVNSEDGFFMTQVRIFSFQKC